VHPDIAVYRGRGLEVHVERTLEHARERGVAGVTASLGDARDLGAFGDAAYDADELKRGNLGDTPSSDRSSRVIYATASSATATPALGRSTSPLRISTCLLNWRTRHMPAGYATFSCTRSKGPRGSSKTSTISRTRSSLHAPPSPSQP
jgi:hypothetical protein